MNWATVVGIALFLASPIVFYVVWRLAEYRSFPKGDWWFIRKFGFRTWLRYEGERRERAAHGVRFDPLTHGELFLRAHGASDEQVAKAKEMGLA